MIGFALVVGVRSVLGIGSVMAMGGLVVASVFGCYGERHRGKREEREE